ncbi:hypothetical protein BwSH20_72750 [Bradyrhizobium ottawaense]|jgi:hypothetical protein|uniref:Uncharacterized protein n=4 Tax=Bradyrhizobium TaxID=374 RepID=A0A809YHG0_9BRAD|nr:hypothetical protein BKD09_41285 [Bradyrhizobium japonicum]TWI56836.1 hypothetical protein IQ16_08348 [Bradyrhizobium huanghuaihaiense]BBO08048.1 hypothetical protein SG09_73980 [Bradyrhizobium ottawaense]BBZ92448.1 hypothetical protein F07S3_22810 [Bradyrhizobium diazoefficiens]KMJ94714.1 hypothetical protein CF64_35165 [Bradyrhizobium japonicum]
MIKMIQHLQKLPLMKLLGIDRDVPLDESRRGGLILLPVPKLLSPTASFVRGPVLCSGVADERRFHQCRAFGMDGGHVRGAGATAPLAYDDFARRPKGAEMV